MKIWQFFGRNINSERGIKGAIQNTLDNIENVVKLNLDARINSTKAKLQIGILEVQLIKESLTEVEEELSYLLQTIRIYEHLKSKKMAKRISNITVTNAQEMISGANFDESVNAKAFAYGFNYAREIQDEIFPPSVTDEKVTGDDLANRVLSDYSQIKPN